MWPLRGSLLAAFMLVALVRTGEAQQAEANAVRSTSMGVYTRAQAARGRDTFAGMCSPCHTPATHTVPGFTSAWAGAQLWELFRFVRENMPKDDPASLGPDEYAQLIAYLLELNGVPPGRDELPADSVALQEIRIDWNGTALRHRTPEARAPHPKSHR
jgi:mono/diheme cytochrome c family protein